MSFASTLSDAFMVVFLRPPAPTREEVAARVDGKRVRVVDPGGDGPAAVA